MWKYFVFAVVLSQCQVRAGLPKLHPDIKRWPEDGKLEFDPDSGDNVTQLSCTSDNDTAIFQWFKRETVDNQSDLIEINNQSPDGFTVDDDTLFIGPNALKVGDIYRCQLNDEKFAEFEVVDETKASDIFRVETFPRSFAVVETQDLRITCNVVNGSGFGYDSNDVAIRWYRWKIPEDFKFEDPELAGGCTPESMVGTLWEEIIENYDGNDTNETHIKLLSSDGMEKSILKIENAVSSDRRGYKCVAYNVTGDIADCSESVTYVRVKDKLAALWPFLGIVAEVILLSACIMFLEKRRTSKEFQNDKNEDEN